MTGRRRIRFGVFLAVGLALALALAVVVSRHASNEPDGLERVAADHGFADHATERDGWSYQGLAAGAGVVVTFGVIVGGGLLYVRRRRPRPQG